MGAIEFTSRPWPDPWSCVSCGVCVAVCPAHALTLSGVDQERMRRRNRILLDRPRSTGDFAPRLLLFGCQRSAVTALSAGPRPNAAMDLAVSPLPCGGKLEDRLVLSALLDGADGVLVSVCHDDNCRTQEGNREAARRYARLIELLGVLGVDPGRVGWVSAAPNQGPDLADKIQAFSEHIQTLGPLETGRRS
jgi:coenzyme F420-reducing hydrogenase delta subunit